MKAIILAFCLMAVGCGPSESPSCDDCSAQQGATLQDPGGCWPYCEGETSDTDGDGVEDSADQCLASPETVNGYMDADGCPDTAPIIPSLSDAYNGIWIGPDSISVGGQSFIRPASFTVTVATGWSTASVTGICPDGTGTVTVRDTASGIVWSGIYSCPPAAWGSCPRAGLIYFGLSLALEDDGGMTLRASGTALFSDLDDSATTECDASGEFSSTLTATR